MLEAWNAFVDFGEKDDTSNTLDNNSPYGGGNSDRGGTKASKSLNGGKGSGNFGHLGRPGLVGGSGGGVGKFLFDGDLPSKNPQPTKEGYVVVHHNTDNETADAIAKEGLVAGKNLGAYQVSPEEGLGIWTDSRAKTDSSYGGCTVSFQIPKEEYEKYAVNDTQHLIPRNIAREDIVCIDKIINENGSNGKPIKVSNLKDNVDYYIKKGLDEKKVISIIAKNSHGIITEQEIKELVDFKKKVANGGPGSGNFGHAGRPGEVGGSAPGTGLASSGVRRKSFVLGDTIRTTYKDKEYVGVLKDVSKERSSEITIEITPKTESTLRASDIHLRVRTATLVLENGEEVQVPFYGVKLVKEYDAPDTTPAERQTPKQKEALEEVSKMINISKAELNYLKTNCSEDSAEALRDELKRAADEGIDFSQVSFHHNNRLSKTQGKVLYQPYTTGSYLPPLDLQMSGKWIADGENYKKKQQKNYEDGWHTSAELAGILRHELGHIKSAQLALRLFDASKEQDGKRVLTSQEVKYRNEKLCQEIVKKANQGYSVYSLSYGKGKDVSEYAVTDRSYAELVAESYSNPEFSEVTRQIAKTLDSEFKNRKNSIMLKFENKVEMDDTSDSLCTGYPMSKQDWEILHGVKEEKYTPIEKIN